MEKEIIVNFMYQDDGEQNSNSGPFPIRVTYNDKVLSMNKKVFKDLVSSISDDLMEENEVLNVDNIVKKLSTKKGIVSVAFDTTDSYIMYI